ncbi:aminotransferase class I/II-fold pyridoxal phosphate-dependent enzyme, partial [Bacillus cereus]|nr:aminotransferase class I/II-fold pyridoxal phosphate-dependent enzyme [Bacillus cereus]
MKQFELSRSAESLKPSGIRKFFDLAANMKGVISLGVGEPDFVTPWNVRQACIRSLEQGYTSYTANAGLLELRQEIAKYLKKQFAVSYDPSDEIIVTVGASQALDVAMRAIINPDDEVLIIEPSFVSYAPLVTLAGGVPVPVATTLENEFKVQPEQIEAAITAKTKAILLCSPNN